MVDLSESQRKELIKIARSAIDSVFENKEKDTKKQLFKKYNDSFFNQKLTMFVALYKKGMIRGRHGDIDEKVKLWEGVFDYAIKAAFNDKRFPMLKDGEKFTINISLTSDLENISLDEIQEGLGIVMEYKNRSALFLPEVWKQLEDKEDFLIHLSVQAGLGIYDWKKEGAVFKKFTTEEIHEQ